MIRVRVRVGVRVRVRVRVRVSRVHLSGAHRGDVRVHLSDRGLVRSRGRGRGRVS